MITVTEENRIWMFEGFPFFDEVFIPVEAEISAYDEDIVFFEFQPFEPFFEIFELSVCVSCDVCHALLYHMEIILSGSELWL